MTDPADREIRLALWKLHILHHAERGPVYGLWLLDELAEHGHRLSPGTLYPILGRMERNGWIRSKAPRRANARRDYRITAAGRRILARLRNDVDALHRELVLGVEPGHGEKADRSKTRAPRRGRGRRRPRTPARRDRPRRREPVAARPNALAELGVIAALSRGPPSRRRAVGYPCRR